MRDYEEKSSMMQETASVTAKSITVRDYEEVSGVDVRNHMRRFQCFKTPLILIVQSLHGLNQSLKQM